jgi:hypothetical protein
MTEGNIEVNARIGPSRRPDMMGARYKKKVMMKGK